MKIETAVKLAKPFVGSLTKNPGSRPILKTALVTEEYVIATDTHRLIRIKHDETVNVPFLYHYKEYDETASLDAKSYPKTERLIPDPNYSTSSGSLDTKEMLEAIEGACVAAEFNHKVNYEQALAEENRKPKHLQRKADTVKKATKPSVLIRVNKMEIKAEFNKFESGDYTYTFDKALPIPEETAFNPEYLKTVFKTFKAAKETEINSHFYSKLRPWYLTAGDIEIILLPVRTY